MEPALQSKSPYFIRKFAANLITKMQKAGLGPLDALLVIEALFSSFAKGFAEFSGDPEMPEKLLQEFCNDVRTQIGETQ